MAKSILAIVLAWVAITSNALDENSTYWQDRKLLLAQEQTTIMGQSQILNADEQVLNDFLMNLKMQEMETSFTSTEFLPAKNFLLARQEIEASEVYKIIKLMPKGAALHLHDTAITTVSWVISEITYWDNLYMRFDETTDQLFLKFMETPDPTFNWQLVSERRASYSTPKEFDDFLQGRLSLVLDNPEEKFPDINSVWSAFEGTLIASTDMVMHRKAWEAYHYQSLKEFMEDNVLYVEFRGTLPRLTELDGTQLTELESVAVYQAINKKFKADHPEQYFGTRFIYAPLRNVDNATSWNYVNLAKQLKQEFPEYVAGFDLVGQEDLGVPLKDFVDPLSTLSEGEIKVPVFYHAGETTWMGMSTDENLIDALLLNSSRLGHGYAITKHPEAKQLALERDVPLEICPISNQVLMLISDLRNHPAAGLISEGFPIVVSADDPATWGAVGLSHDFYEAFMALGGAKADLRFLKQLAINSIRYSSLDQENQEALMNMWQEKWDEFIATMKRHMNPNAKMVAATLQSTKFSPIPTTVSGATVATVATVVGETDVITDLPLST